MSVLVTVQWIYGYWHTYWELTQNCCEWQTEENCIHSFNLMHSYSSSSTREDVSALALADVLGNVTTTNGNWSVRLLLSLLFNDAANCQDYIALVIDEWIWSSSGLKMTGGRPKYLEKNVPQCQFVHHKSQTGLPSAVTTATYLPTNGTPSCKLPCATVLRFAFLVSAAQFWRTAMAPQLLNNELGGIRKEAVMT